MLHLCWVHLKRMLPLSNNSMINSITISILSLLVFMVDLIMISYPKSFKGFSSPLPFDVAVELNNVLNTLNGTKECIKGAKIWFMQKSLFAPALAEALRDRVFALDDVERQLHIIYLANDIPFDSMNRRTSSHGLENEALAFKPVLGSMLARIFHNPQSSEEYRKRLQQMVDFWASKEIYDQETISLLKSEMIIGPPSGSYAGLLKDLSSASVDSAVGMLQQTPNYIVHSFVISRSDVTHTNISHYKMFVLKEKVWE